MIIRYVVVVVVGIYTDYCYIAQPHSMVFLVFLSVFLPQLAEGRKGLSVNERNWKICEAILRVDYLEYSRGWIEK